MHLRPRSAYGLTPPPSQLPPPPSLFALTILLLKEYTHSARFTFVGQQVQIQTGSDKLMLSGQKYLTHSVTVGYSDFLKKV